MSTITVCNSNFKIFFHKLYSTVFLVCFFIFHGIICQFPLSMNWSIKYIKMFYLHRKMIYYSFVFDYFRERERETMTTAKYFLHNGRRLLPIILHLIPPFLICNFTYTDSVVINVKTLEVKFNLWQILVKIDNTNSFCI